ASCDAVAAVLRDLDHRGPRVVMVDLVARLDTVDRIAERARWTVANGPNDLVHAARARADEWIPLGVKCALEPVGAETGVLTDPAVVEDGDVESDMGIAAINGPIRVLAAAEPNLGMTAVAEGLGHGRAAPAQRHGGSHRDRASEPICEAFNVG